MKTFLIILGLLVSLLPGAPEAHAQASVALYCYQGPTNPQWAPCSASNPLVTSGGGGGGLSVMDTAAWTAGVSNFTPGGGVFNDTATLTTGQQGTFRMTTKRAQVVDTDTSGNALYSAITAAVPCLNATASTTNTYTTGQTNGANCNLNGGLYVQASNDVCSQKAKTNLPISQNGTSSVQLIGVSGATTIYVCSVFLMTNSTATTAAITTGTGTACVTNNAAVIGTTTSNIANSMNLIAGAGFTYGNGAATVGQGAASSELCLILGSNVYVSGNLTYVQQ